MLYFVKKGVKRKRFVQYMQRCCTYRTCRKWLVKLCAGGVSLDNASWLGRPVEVDRDQIETLIENNQRSAPWEIANILKISKSTKLVKIKNASFMKKNHTDFLANPVCNNALFGS